MSGLTSFGLDGPARPHRKDYEMSSYDYDVIIIGSGLLALALGGHVINPADTEAAAAAGASV